MNVELFIERAKSLVLDEKTKLTKDNVIVVWLSKVLQNNKALLITDDFDGKYYEVTYNGDQKEFYIDTYEKTGNRSEKLIEKGE